MPPSATVRTDSPQFPDVPGAVARDEAKGYAVAEPAKSFKLEFEGCRRIEQEEWDILVAQHKLEEKTARTVAASQEEQSHG
ncbi:hypothetical protein [Ralstonia pseudosolanacearum]|uniref:hypothetical protein n=1 Tax=Ralstonia pseudosolanacearum TaxID=1310165 RepID=UPI003CF239E8